MFIRTLFAGLLIAGQVAGLAWAYPEDSYNGLTLMVTLSGDLKSEGGMVNPFSASILDVQSDLQSISEVSNQNVVLLDPKGEIFHEWTTPYSQKRFAFLNGDGSLAFRANTANQPTQANENDPAVLQELDWDSEVIWEWTHPYFHHDMAKLPNGNYLAIVWEELSDETYSLLGADPEVKTLWGDSIVEVDRETGEIIWEWSLDENVDPLDYVWQVSKGVEWSHLNAVEYLPAGNVFNGIESFLISSRHLSTVWLVEMETGDVAWESPRGLMEGQHDPTLLENGNILIFDNGSLASKVIEIAPSSDEIVWTYEHEDFFSSHISGAQRLPNGNTLITEGASGRIFEVSLDGEIVWEYEVEGQGLSAERGSSVFRAYRYGLDDIDWPENEEDRLLELFEDYSFDEEESDSVNDDEEVSDTLDVDFALEDEEVNEDSDLRWLILLSGGMLFVGFWVFWYSVARKRV